MGWPELISKIKGRFIKDLEAAKTSEDVENVRVFYLGRSGVIKELERAIWH